MNSPRVGVLALQGAFREHCEAFSRLGHDCAQVRTVEQLRDVDALVIPGGESSAIGKLLRTSGLEEPLRDRLAANDIALFGTCAGMILSATEVLDGVDDQLSLGAFEASVRRNAIGAQRMSFETELMVVGIDRPVPAVFIRPPEVESASNSVRVLAEHRNKPVLCAQGRHLFATFHPELTGDVQIHHLFLENLRASS